MKIRNLLSLSLLTVLVLMVFTGCCCCKKKEVTPVASNKEAGTRPGTPDVKDPFAGKVKPIYFDFDKFNIRKDQEAVLNANVDFLKTLPAVKFTVEGNCDERGTVEYNLALGEKRANAVRAAILAKGIDPSRVAVLSKGKGNPVVANAANEADHQKNRRAEFIATK
ncbi:TPA: peptidoglycan-associated lipoprotein [Candidatus Sumerlaeota bacterium]|jgi:peptidoglycan-associated lipoprotein|nr:peptidoglycan-associated lipoprotein [Candidatus Sumerlaeota bacterium]